MARTIPSSTPMKITPSEAITERIAAERRTRQ